MTKRLSTAEARQARDGLATDFRNGLKELAEHHRDVRTPHSKLADTINNAVSSLVIIRRRMDAADASLHEAEATEMGARAQELRRKAADLEQKVATIETAARAAVEQHYGPDGSNRVGLLRPLGVTELLAEADNARTEADALERDAKAHKPYREPERADYVLSLSKLAEMPAHNVAQYAPSMFSAAVAGRIED